MTAPTLVQRLKKKSPEAFEELVSEYARRLYSVSLRILRNPQDAEDAVQETFLKVLQSIDSFREDSSLYTWLYHIVSNESLMKLRREGKREVVPIEPYLPKFEQGQHKEQIHDWSQQLPDQTLETQELSDFFAKCIDELPEHYRIAYILKDVEKLSEDQVCNILRISKWAMKSRVHRARLAIRERVGERFFKDSRSKGGRGACNSSPR